MRKIVVIDDNKACLDMIVGLLRWPEGQYEIHTAQNGLEGIHVAEEEEPLVIIMDIMMPVMDGFSALKMLKQEKKTKDIPVLMLTSINSPEDIVKALYLGASDFLKKPFDVRELTVRVNNLARLRSAQLENKRYIEILESKAEMLHTLAEGAHDLYGMLSSMGAMELLKDEVAEVKKNLPDNIAEVIADNLKLVEKAVYNTNIAVEIGKSIVSSTMSMSEIISISRKEYHAKELIESTLGFLTYRIIKNGINIKIDISEKVTIFVEKTEWQRMILNLLKNSIDALEEKEHKFLFITCKCIDTKIIFEFYDNGRGIERNKILGLLNTPDGINVNKGVGIDSVRRVVSKYKGEFEIESIFGEWTKIIIAFDRKELTKESYYG